jgi:hypothetical protein
MATYKVIQDIEAEDKLVGPLTLRQFIYGLISAASFYFCFLSITKHVDFMVVIFFPVAAATGFFAFPWGKDQPTEIWALAKIRFFIKPRRRIWDQSGAKELVTITVPKKIAHQYTNGLNQDEVNSRLTALANTIDSRGWAVKNVNVNLGMITGQAAYGSDRLINPGSFPQEVSTIDVRASDDMLDESANPIAQQFDSMINASAAAHRKQLMDQLAIPSPAMPIQTPAAVPLPQPTAAQFSTMPQQAMQPTAQPATNPQPMQQQNYWFTQPQPTAAPAGNGFMDGSSGMALASGAPPAPVSAATPTAEEQALIAKFKQENSAQTVAYSHLKTVKTPEQLAAEAAQARAAAKAKPSVTPQEQAAIINLSNNDDLDVATLARQAHKQVEDDGEVVISLR